MADGGFLRKGKKSGIVKCLYDVDRCVSVPSNVTVTVYDMLAVAHIVNPCDKGYKFADFTPKCLVPYLMRNTSASVNRLMQFGIHILMKIPLRNSRGTSIRTLLGENG